MLAESNLHHPILAAIWLTAQRGFRACKLHSFWMKYIWKVHSRNASNVLLLLMGIQAMDQTRPLLKLILPELCTVGMLGPLPWLSSCWAALLANVDISILSPQLISELALNYNPVGGSLEVYTVCWPFVINTKWRKVPTASLWLFREKTGVGCYRFNRLWHLRYSTAREPFSSNQCLQWVETGLKCTTLNMNQWSIIANTHPSLPHISVVLLVQEAENPVPHPALHLRDTLFIKLTLWSLHS